MPQQPSEPLAAFDSVQFDFRPPGRIFGNPKRPVAQRLVGPEFVVIAGVRLHYVVQLPQTEAGKVIQALPLQGPAPPTASGSGLPLAA